MVKIGVVALQGAITEHVRALAQAFEDLGIAGEITLIKKTLGDIDGLILPGGESTTMASLLIKIGLDDKIRAAAETLPIMGTCAGCVLLGKSAQRVRTLGLMSMDVERNAFGRQKESFQYPVLIEGFKEPFPGVFIRAPAIRQVQGHCKALAYVNNKIVMAQEGHLIAASFHPELVTDLRVHEYFLGLI